MGAGVVFRRIGGRVVPMLKSAAQDIGNIRHGLQRTKTVGDTFSRISRATGKVNRAISGHGELFEKAQQSIANRGWEAGASFNQEGMKRAAFGASAGEYKALMRLRKTKGKLVAMHGAATTLKQHKSGRRGIGMLASVLGLGGTAAGASAYSKRKDS